MAAQEHPPPKHESGEHLNDHRRSGERALTERPSAVALLSPSLGTGGAERWMATLVHSTDPRRVRWVGLLATPGAPVDERMHRELRALLPIVSLDQPATPADADVREFRLPAAIRAADVLVSWGIGDLAPFLGAFDGLVVHVSHASGIFGVHDTPAAPTLRNVAVSRRALSSIHPSSRAAATVLYNGVDSRRCRPVRSRAEVRARWGLGARDVAIGFVGRFDWRKDPLAAARAIATLGPRYVPVYVGAGSYEATLRARAHELAPRAVFQPFTDAVGDVYAAIDVLVLASLGEAFNLTIAEAWHCGVPVAATRVGAIPELERVHGQLVSPIPLGASDAAIADAIRRAVQPGFRASIVARARELALRELGARHMGERWSEYLYSLRLA